MKALAHSVPIRYFSQLVDALEQAGGFSRSSLPAAQLGVLAEPQGKTTLAGVDMLIGELAGVTGRSDLGFEAGRLVKLTSHDELGYAIINCSTMDHVLRLAARYYRLMTPLFDMRYVRHARHAEVMFLPVVAMPEQTLHYFLELQAVSFHMQVSAITQGAQPPFEIFMGMPAPPHARRYRELELARCQFGEAQLPGVRIRFDACYLDQRMPMHDARALVQAEARCQQKMEEFNASGKWSDWVAMMLRHAEDCQPTQRELASMLNISARTLDRCLALEDTRFRDLAVRIRNERAKALLAEGGQGVSQIAYRLGYTDIANFSRSFKRINGISPSAYMEQAQAAQD